MAVPFKSTVFTGGSFAASGSNGHASAGLLIYSASRTTSGLMPTADLAAVGRDVFLYISGVAGSRGTSNPGTVVIGGDLLVSGTAYDVNGNVIGESPPTFLYSTTAGSVYTTGSFAFVGNEAGVDSPLDKGTDVNFYVKGTAGSRGTGTAGTALFSGDLYVSGTVYSNEFKSTIISSSIIYSSGSTLFGNSADDTHTFIGNITGSADMLLTGSLTVKGSVTLPGTIYLTGPGGQNIIHDGGSGNLSLYSNSGNVYIEGTLFNGNDVAILGDLQVNGGDLTTPATTMNIFNSAAYINFGIGAEIRMGSSASTTIMYGSLSVEGSTSLGNASSDRTDVTGSFRSPIISGSLTKLTSGLSYLVAGSNVTITTASNGQVTIDSTGTSGGGGSSYFDSIVAGATYSTGSLALAGTEGITNAASKGTDVFFYASGSAGSRGSATGKIALFRGDTVVSGSSYVSGSLYVGLDASRGRLSYDNAASVFTVGSAGGKVQIDAVSYEVNASVLYNTDGTWQAYSTAYTLNNYDTNTQMLSITEPGDSGDVIFEIGRPEFELAELRVNGQIFASGSITSLLPYNYIKSAGGFSGSLTSLTDGRSYLAAGSNVTITSESNGQITISSAGGGGGSPGGSNTYVQFNDSGAFGGTGGLTFNKTTGAFQVTGSLIASSSTGIFVFDGTQPTVTVRASADTTNQAVFYQESVGDTYVSNQKNGGGLYNTVKTTGGTAVRFMRAIPNAVNYNTIVAFLQGLHDFFDPKLETNDVGFYVGGKKGSKDSTTRGVALFAGDMVVSGSTHMQNGGSITGSFSIQGSIVPSEDSTHTLGTDTNRWAHVYTGDLHLRNERGDWTILEEPDFLCVINNRTGKKYKMMLQPID